MPTSSQALNILREFNPRPESARNWYDYNSAEDDGLTFDHHSKDYPITKVTSHPLDKAMDVTCPGANDEPRLSKLLVDIPSNWMTSQSCGWTSKSHSPVLPPVVEEGLEESMPPPPSACPSLLDQYRDDGPIEDVNRHNSIPEQLCQPTPEQNQIQQQRKQHEFHGEAVIKDTFSAKNCPPITTPTTFREFDFRFNYDKAPHRWGSRPITRCHPKVAAISPRGILNDTAAEREEIQRGGVTLPKIQPDATATSLQGQQSRCVTIKMGGESNVSFLQQQNKIGLDPAAFCLESLTSCDDVIGKSIGAIKGGNRAKFLYQVKKRDLNKKRQALINALRNSDEKDVDQTQAHIINILGSKEGRRLLRLMAASEAQQASRGQPPVVPLASAGDALCPSMVPDRLWGPTSRNKFSVTSGSLPSQGRRGASRISLPSNLLDFTLRYGNGIRLNGVLEAKGRHLFQASAALPGDGRPRDMRRSHREGPGGIPIAEGVDFDDLLSYKTKDLKRRPLSGVQIPSDPLPCIGRESPATNLRESPFNLTNAGIVEQHGFCPSADDDNDALFRSEASSRFIDVSGSAPGSRRPSHFLASMDEELYSAELGQEEIINRISKSERRSRRSPNKRRSNAIISAGTSEEGEENANVYTDERDLVGNVEGANNNGLPSRSVARYTRSQVERNDDVLHARIRDIGKYKDAWSDKGHSSSIVNHKSSEAIILASKHYSGNSQGGNPMKHDYRSTLSVAADGSEDNHANVGGLSPTDNDTSRSLKLRDLSRKSFVDDEATTYILRGSGRPSRDSSTSQLDDPEMQSRSYIRFQDGPIIPPSKSSIAQAQCLDTFLEEEADKELRKYEACDGMWGNTDHGLTEEDDVSQFLEEDLHGMCFWENEREAQLFKRIKSKVLRMRRVLPPMDPSKLCSISYIPGCSHEEVKAGIEAIANVKVTHLEYDPVYLQEDNIDKYVSLWIFKLTHDSNEMELMLHGFQLKSRPMNVRRMDDVIMEEYRAFHMYNAIRMEQRKKKLTKRKFKKRR